MRDLSTSLRTLIGLGACLPLLVGCGYHHIGSPLPTLASHVGSPVAKKPRTSDAADASAPYFPVEAHATYHYARHTSDTADVGSATLALGELTTTSEGREAPVTQRIEGHERLTTLATAGSVVSSATSLVLDLPPVEAANGLDGFALQLPLVEGHTWSRSLGGLNWTSTVRRVERVNVPAGDYDCIVVEATGRNSALETRLHQVKQTLYFARGVGLIKFSRVEDDQGNTSSNERTLTEELVSISGVD